MDSKINNKGKIVFFDINQYDNLSELEKETLSKINENPFEFINGSITKISKSFYSSKSSISRLSQKIGFKHLLDMKLYVMGRVAIQDLYNTAQEQTTQDRIGNLKSYNIFTINESLLSIDKVEFTKIVKRLITVKKILCFGLGSSYLASFELSQNLSKLGMNAISTNDIHNMLITISGVDDDSLLILFSKAAQNKEIVYLLKVCQELKIDTLLITNNSEIATNVKYKIIIKDFFKDKRLIATSSKTCMLVISDLIYYELYYLTEGANKKLDRANKLLEEWKKFSFSFSE